MHTGRVGIYAAGQIDWLHTTNHHQYLAERVREIWHQMCSNRMSDRSPEERDERRAGGGGGREEFPSTKKRVI